MPTPLEQAQRVRDIHAYFVIVTAGGAQFVERADTFTGTVFIWQVGVGDDESQTRIPILSGPL